MGYLQVNALSEWIIGIYLHEFTNNEREISIPHSAASCGIEKFEFIVSELVQVNPNNSRAMSALTFLLFKLNTLQTKIVKLWDSRSHGVTTVVYCIYTNYAQGEIAIRGNRRVTWIKSGRYRTLIRWRSTCRTTLLVLFNHPNNGCEGRGWRLEQRKFKTLKKNSILLAYFGPGRGWGERNGC